MIDFDQKINYRRFVDRNQQERNSIYAVVRCFESDRGRIINSAAIRRLQQKTQVFPLERNAVVRSRLTHSLEVQQVGRYIVKEILDRLQRRYPDDEIHLQKWAIAVESLVEMACLMHDIGNPPFGHFGEAAIKQWFSQRLALGKPASYTILNEQPDETERNLLRNKMRQDLCQFEGNAQAIRLVHSLLKLNLTYSQVACILKYTRPAYWYEAIPGKYNYLMKKPGYYLSEEPFINQLQSELAMAPYHRFPLTYIMEAADDISYCIADLDDAVEKRIFSVDQLYEYLRSAWGVVKKGDLFTQTVDAAFRTYSQLKKQKLLPTAIDQFFMTLRVKTIGQLVPHAAERFNENLTEVFAGSFNQALLEDFSAEDKLLRIFKTVGNQHVFNHDSVENAELQGYRIISSLLDIYSPLLAMPCEAFYELVQKQSLRDYPIESRLFHKLSAKHCIAYQQAVETYQDSTDFELWEFYYRCRLIQDYISGMTDHFAYDEYRQFMVAD